MYCVQYMWCRAYYTFTISYPNLDFMPFGVYLGMWTLHRWVGVCVLYMFYIGTVLCCARLNCNFNIIIYQPVYFLLYIRTISIIEIAIRPALILANRVLVYQKKARMQAFVQKKHSQ